MRPARVTIERGLLAAELVVDIRLPLLPLLVSTMSLALLKGVLGRPQSRPVCPKTAAAAWWVQLYGTSPSTYAELPEVHDAPQ